MPTTTTTQASGTIASLITTGLNSLANNALVAGSAYSASGGYVFAEIELVATFGVAPTANTGVNVWFCRAPDGTNYEDGFDASVTPNRPADVVIGLRAVTTAQRQTKECLLPPGTWIPVVKNDGTGQAMAASGNTLKINPFTLQNG